MFSCRRSSDSLCAPSGCGILKGEMFVFKSFEKMLVLISDIKMCKFNKTVPELRKDGCFEVWINLSIKGTALI